jgi:hypothetical protein
MNKKIIISLLAFTVHCILHGMNTDPIIINSPGLFSLVGPLDFGLSSSGQACIVVASNDVQIDLGGFSVRQVPGFEQPDTTGILINSDMQNITIKNGVITNMTSYGIQIMDDVNSVSVTDLIINDVKNAGVFADSTRTGTGITNLFLNNVTAENISNLNGDPAYGFLLKFVNSSEISNGSLVHNIQTSSGNCYGLKLKNCTSTVVDNLISNDNIGGGLLTAGIYLARSENCQIQNSFSINNTGTSSNPNSLTLGFGFNSSNNILCQSCIALDNSSTYSSCGFFSNNGNGIQYSSCESFGNNSSLLDGLGFSANNGLLIELHSCISKGSGGANNGYGVFFNTLDISSIQNCDIRGNTGFAGTSYGIDLNNTTTSYIAHNTIAFNIGGPITFGLFDNAGAATTNTIVSNIAISNGTNYSPGALTIPIYVGTLATFDTTNPFTFQNVSI